MTLTKKTAPRQAAIELLFELVVGKPTVALKELTIKNIAVIESTQLHFSEGLNVLTGETGAGKSMILAVIDLIMGGKAQSHLLRQGCDQAACEARFSFADSPIALQKAIETQLRDLGVEPDEDGEVIIRRTLHLAKDGVQSRIFINGQAVTRTTLQHLCGGWIDVSSQHDQQRLLKPAFHQKVLDEFIGETSPTLQAAFSKLKEIHDRYRFATEKSVENLQRRDFLEFQIRELDALDMHAGEMEALTIRLKRLSNQSHLKNLADTALHELEQKDGSIIDSLLHLEKQFEKAAGLDAAYEPLARGLQESRLSLIDLAARMAQTNDAFEDDSTENIDAIEKRMADLHRIERKYGQKIDVIVERLPKLKQEFEQLNLSQEDIANLQADGEKALAAFISVAEVKSRKISEKIPSLEKQVEKSLAALAMPKAKFQVLQTSVDVTTLKFPHMFETEVSAEGIDRIEFLIAPNPGQGFFPLAKIASGGELSRILLALKSITKPANDLALHFFDEIDAGIGGETARTVGELLKKMSKAKQVLCITHLPQIACFANQHLRIQKSTHKGKTQTTISRLESNHERIDELARMLGGEKLTPVARTHAKELLAHAT